MIYFQNIILQSFVMFNLYIIIFGAAKVDICLKIPKIKIDESCCAVPMLIPDDIADKCDLLVYAETRNLLHDELVLSECVFTSSGMGKNGTVSAVDVKRVIAPKLEQESEMKSIVFEAIDQCVKMANELAEENKEKVRRPPYNINDLNPIYAYVTQCIITSIIANCPKSAAMDTISGKCKKMKKYLKECGYTFPSPFLQD